MSPECIVIAYFGRSGTYFKEPLEHTHNLNGRESAFFMVPSEHPQSAAIGGKRAAAARDKSAAVAVNKHERSYIRAH